MNQNHSEDIRVGDNEFIRCIPVPTKESATFEPLDPFLRGVRNFLDSLEVECCAECCGIHAYKFSAPAIRVAALNFGPETMANEFRNIVEQIRDAESEYFVSDRLNYYFHKSVLVQLFQHLARCIENQDNEATI